jgi:hypothetical protein
VNVSENITKGLAMGQKFMSIVKEGRPFCQIAKQEISAAQCLQIQGQKSCFGCASPCRLCEKCKQFPVNIPAVGLCSECAVNELKTEQRQRPLPAGATNACKSCKKKRCRFPAYGLCLKCSISRYGGGWKAQTHQMLAPPPLEVFRVLLGVKGKRIQANVLRRFMPHLSHDEALAHLDTCECYGWVGPSESNPYGWRTILIHKDERRAAYRPKRPKQGRQLPQIDEVPAISQDEKLTTLRQIIRVMGDRGRQVDVLRAIIEDLTSHFGSVHATKK